MLSLRLMRVLTTAFILKSRKKKGDYSLQKRMDPDRRAYYFNKFNKKKIEWTSLHMAVENDDTEKVKDLIKNQATNVNTRSKYGFTALHLACQNGNRGVVKLLLAQGAEINGIGPDQMIPLHFAAKHAHKKVVELLLKQGADVHARDFQKRTPLHLAVKDEEVVECLLENGADIHATDCMKYDTLHLAVERGYIKVVKLLIDKGANVHTLNLDGYSPLKSAAKSILYETERLQCIKILIRTIVLQQHETTPAPDYLRLNLPVFWKDCQSQVKRMRTTLLGECALSVYQFLRETDENILAGYLSNTDVREALERAQEDFLTYDDNIEIQLNKGKKRRILMCQGIGAMEHLKYLPVEINYKIINHLNNADLENLGKSGCSVRECKV